MNIEDIKKLLLELEKNEKNLDLIAINMEIEAAHLTEKNGIRPIAEQLRSIISKTQKITKELTALIEK